MVEDDGAPLTARSGAAVPGYTGYVPGKAAEAENMGKRFAMANVDGFSRAGVRAPLRGQAPASPKYTVSKPAPGYSGHVSGKIEDVYGTGWNSSNLHAATPRMAQSSRSEVRPGDLVASKPSRRIAEIAQSPRAGNGSSPVRPGTGQAAVAVPGYTGHVPGKDPEDVVGSRFSAANAVACVEFGDKKAPVRNAWKRTDAPGVEARRNSGAAAGKTVPGYTGHVHGKTPEAGVMGLRFAAANTKADQDRRTAKALQPKTAPSPDRMPVSPMAKHFDTVSEASSVRPGYGSRKGPGSIASSKSSTVISSKPNQRVKTNGGYPAQTPDKERSKTSSKAMTRSPTGPAAVRPVQARAHVPGYGGHKPNNFE
eukprot:TRINITY_DN35674_c0_g1_i1.p1 TRINITY_DN35674_c0_g1~~TRINITY_DN35674_c0_g1_i1.p1  ORF type:complete len:367 (-),score=70.06 TRINITY_DN35674_c0_g1_i1:33-1133(-)